MDTGLGLPHSGVVWSIWRSERSLWEGAVVPHVPALW